MSCLFDSLAQFVDMHSHDLRQGICDFLQTNPKLTDDMSAENVVQFESGVPLERYVVNMRQATVMGGATEIKAFCIIFKRNVKVKSEPNDKIIEFVVRDDYPFVGLRWTGGHYDPMFD
jgi:hypothetical protein